MDVVSISFIGWKQGDASKVACIFRGYRPWYSMLSIRGEARASVWIVECGAVCTVVRAVCTNDYCERRNGVGRKHGQPGALTSTAPVIRSGGAGRSGVSHSAKLGSCPAAESTKYFGTLQSPTFSTCFRHPCGWIILGRARPLCATTELWANADSRDSLRCFACVVVLTCGIWRGTSNDSPEGVSRG